MTRYEERYKKDLKEAMIIYLLLFPQDKSININLKNSTNISDK